MMPAFHPIERLVRVPGVFQAKNGSRRGAIRLLAFLLAVVPALGTGASAEPGSNHLNVERSGNEGVLSPMSEAEIEQIAGVIGGGHFLVHAEAFPDDGSPTDGTWVLSIYPSVGSVPQAATAQHIVVRAGVQGAPRQAHTPEEIIAGFFSAVNGWRDDDSISRQLPRVVAIALSVGPGQGPGGEWPGQLDFSAIAPGAGPASGRSAQSGEARATMVSRDAAGRTTWQVGFVRGDGARDDVIVIFPARPGTLVELVLKGRPSAETANTRSSARPSFEEWTVSSDSSWKLPTRFKMVRTLAALGNAPKQFQLGVALLQEAAPEAKAEGIRWLEAAAAQGYRDAVAVLAEGRSLLERSDRERDNVRVNCCRPPPGR